MESESGEDGECVGNEMRGCAGWELRVGNRARQDFARGMHRHVALSDESLQGALLQGTVTGHHHRALSQATHHRITTQGTATGYRHRAPVTGSTATNLCHG